MFVWPEPSAFIVQMSGARREPSSALCSRSQATLRPSGDHAGWSSATPGALVSCVRTAGLLTLSLKISLLQRVGLGQEPAGLLEKASCVESGDHDGHWSSIGPEVSRVWPPPSEFMTHRSPGEPANALRTNATRPLGAHTGWLSFSEAVSAVAGCVSWRMPPPLALMVKIA